MSVFLVDYPIIVFPVDSVVSTAILVYSFHE